MLGTDDSLKDRQTHCKRPGGLWGK